MMAWGCRWKRLLISGRIQFGLVYYLMGGEKFVYIIISEIHKLESDWLEVFFGSQWKLLIGRGGQHLVDDYITRIYPSWLIKGHSG